ncbi:unnamed protein product [Moneuplotes crassus]|uniref:Uncharacterized protein n=1 Tax=Euplotes crassus TaxID=5936 RepID=A0AAD1Y799_EUPCR|nr:unnamed protein product [Moneuplotes crassus]
MLYTHCYRETLQSLINTSSTKQNLLFVETTMLYPSLRELTKFEKGSMEYGYDVDFPKLYQPKHFAKRKHGSKLASNNKSLNLKYSLSPARNYANYNSKDRILITENKTTNLSTIMPRASSSNGKLVDGEVTLSKKGNSPKKKLKLPALASLNNYNSISYSKNINAKSKINEKVERSLFSSSSKPSRYSKKALDMTHEINYNKIADEADSLHEFIIITLSKAFKAKPRPSEGFVNPNDFKFLTVAVVKGNKKESYCLRKWYKYLHKYISRMVEVILSANPQRIPSQIANMMNVVKVGLFSKDATTVKLTTELLLKIISEFSQTYYISYFWDWIKEQDQVLKFQVDIFGRHPDLGHNICQFLIKIAYNHLEELFMEHLLKICDSDIYKYLETIQAIMALLKDMSDDYPDIETFFLSGLVQTSWIDFLISHLKNDASDPNSVRQICITFLGEIISTFKCDSSRVNVAIDSLFEASKTPWKFQKLTAFTVLFNILSKFAATKNKHARKIYKFLAQSVPKYHNNEDLREFLVSNMAQILTENPIIPLEVVLNPLISTIKKFLDDTYYLNCYDFNFFSVIVNHKKLTLVLALKVCKILAWMSIKSMMYHKPALRLLMVVLNRYIHVDQMSNFTTKLLKYLFTILYEIEKHESGLSHKPNSVLNSNLLRHNTVVVMNNTLFPGRGVTCEFDPSLNNDQKKILKRSLCLSVAMAILDIPDSQLQERGVIVLRSMMSKLKFKYSLKPDWLEKLKRKIRQKTVPLIGASLRNIHGEIEQPIVMRKNPNKLKLANRALDEYLVDDVINDDCLDTEVHELSSEGYLKHEMSSHNESEQNSERFISFLSDKDKQQREADDKRLYMQRLRMEFTTFSLPEENTQLSKDLDALLLSYKKSIMFLFKKYSATKEFDKKEEFESYKPLKNRLNISETCKLLRERTISEYFLTPDEIAHIVREVNSLLRTPQEECQYLSYHGLEILLVQIAVHISRKYFYKKGRAKSLLENIERLFRRMSLVREEREISLDHDLSMNLEKLTMKNSHTFSPVKAYIKEKIGGLNKRGRNLAKQAGECISSSHNLTYSLKKRIKALEKQKEEKEWKMHQKLRDLKRKKRRKELEKSLKEQSKGRIENKRHKFDDQIFKLEKAKKKIKNAFKQKEKFLKNIKNKVEEGQDYNHLVSKALQEEGKEKEIRLRNQKHQYRQERLREKRHEFDRRYSKNNTLTKFIYLGVGSGLFQNFAASDTVWSPTDFSRDNEGLFSLLLLSSSCFIFKQLRHLSFLQVWVANLVLASAILFCMASLFLLSSFFSLSCLSRYLCKNFRCSSCFLSSVFLNKSIVYCSPSAVSKAVTLWFAFRLEWRVSCRRALFLFKDFLILGLFRDPVNLYCHLSICSCSWICIFVLCFSNSFL